MKKKIETNFIIFRALFWAAQPKQKKKIIFLPTLLKWQHSLHANFFSKFFPSKFLLTFFQIFIFQLLFF